MSSNWNSKGIALAPLGQGARLPTTPLELLPHDPLCFGLGGFAQFLPIMPGAFKSKTIDPFADFSGCFNEKIR